VGLAPGDIPRLNEISMSWPVLGFTAGLAIVTTIVTGLLPALQTRRVDLQTPLKTAGHATAAGARTRRWLVAGQIAVTFVLLVAAALLMRSFAELRQVDVGFESTGVLTGELRFATNRLPGNRRPWSLLEQLYDRVLDGVRSLPGVESVSGITGLPLTGEGSSGTFWMDDRSGRRPDASKQYNTGVSIVTADYFSTMRIPLLRGRVFTAADRLPESALTNPGELQPSGVVLVNQAFERRFWNGKDAIGGAIKLADHWAVSSSTIVGVVGNVRTEAVERPAEPAVYVPWAEIPGFRLALAIRAGGDPVRLAAEVRTRVRHTEPELLVSNVRPMDGVLREAVSRPRFGLVLVACLAALALALAAVGVYGVLACLVTDRMREMGIRMALGARPRDVVGLVLRDGLRPVVAGGVAGIALALIVTRAMQSLLFGVGSLDGLSFAGAGCALVLASVLATLVPAARATRVDPIAALRDM
jgi:predicted permease